MENDLGISARALSIARILDRLDAGDYMIRFSKAGNGHDHYWTIEISKPVVVDKKTIGKIQSKGA